MCIHGVNRKIAEKIGLKKLSILSPVKGSLKKLVTFVPDEHLETGAKSLI
jgi:hypothetical protein